MGNVISPLNESHNNNMTFATVAMSRYMSITKEQVFFIRRETSLLASSSSNVSNNTGINNNEILLLHDETKSIAAYNYISREKYIHVLQKAKIIHIPDMEVLLLLFTILDNNGTNYVNCTDLCIGLSLFASCKTTNTNNNNMLNTTNSLLNNNNKTMKQNDEYYNQYFYNVIKFAIEIYYYYHIVVPNNNNNNNNNENDSNGMNHNNIHNMKKTNKAMNSLLDPILSKNNNVHDNNSNNRFNNMNNNTNNNDRISFNDAVSILQSMNLSASLLGDTVLDQNQLVQLVKSAFIIDETNNDSNSHNNTDDHHLHDMTQDSFCQSFCKQPIIYNIFLPTSRPGDNTISTKSQLPMNIRLPMNNSKSIPSPTTRISVITTAGFPDSTVKGSTKTTVGAATTAVRNITSSCISNNKKGITTSISPVTSLLIPETHVQILGSSIDVKNSVQMKTMSLPWDDMESSVPVSHNPTPKQQNSLFLESQMFQPKSIMKAPPVLVNQNKNNDISNAGIRNYHHINLPSHVMQSNRSSPSSAAFASFLSSTRQKAIVDTDYTESMNDEDTTSYEVTTDMEDDRTESEIYGPRQLPNITTTRVYLNPPRYYPNQYYHGNSDLLLPPRDDDEESTANTRCTFDDLSSKMSKKMTPLAIVQVVYSTSE